MMLRILLLSTFLFPHAAYAMTIAEPQLFVTQRAVAQGSVPLGAQRVPMLEIVLQSGCATPTTIESLTIHDSRLGLASDIERVYLMKGQRRISRGMRLSADDKSTAIRLPRGFTLPPCESQTITVYADFSASATAGSEHAFMLKNELSVGTSAAVMFERSENTFHEPGIRTTPSAMGTLNISYLPLNKSVRYGVRRIIGRFQLTANSHADQIVSAITFTNEGSARNADLQNVSIMHSNKRLASDVVRSLNAETVRFTFDPPLLIEKNQTRQFTMQADVRASKRRTIRMEIEELSDIESIARKQRGGSYQ